MARTLQERIDAIDALIETIETSGQAISDDGSTLTQANLASLYKQLERYEARQNRASRGPVVVRLEET